MDRVTAGYDQLCRFWLEDAPARGVVVRLEASLANALQHHDYPPAVKRVLRELSAAAVLLASNLKQPALVTLQAQGDGAVKLLCVEATRELTFRTYANAPEDVAKSIAVDASLADMVTGSKPPIFVLTIRPEQGPMYQGIVELIGDSVAETLQQYLTNSQQTDTRIWIREDGDVIEAALLERLPEADQEAAEKSFDAIAILVDATFEQHFMPFPYADWLQMAIPGHDIRVHPVNTVAFACSCSELRVLNALKLVGRDELAPLVEENGKLDTRCEFCGKAYEISAAQFATLFSEHDGLHPPSTRSIQ